jgi:hypothetical protein
MLSRLVLLVSSSFTERGNLVFQRYAPRFIREVEKHLKTSILPEFTGSMGSFSKNNRQK